MKFDCSLKLPNAFEGVCVYCSLNCKMNWLRYTFWDEFNRWHLKMFHLSCVCGKLFLECVPFIYWNAFSVMKVSPSCEGPIVIDFGRLKLVYRWRATMKKALGRDSKSQSSGWAKLRTNLSHQPHRFFESSVWQGPWRAKRVKKKEKPVWKKGNVYQ